MRIYCFIAVLCLAHTVAFAQSGISVSTKVNILVKDFVHISNLGSGQLVTMDLKDEKDFETGITKTVRDNLMISTTVSYAIYARAGFPFFTSIQGAQGFPASILSLEIENKDFAPGKTIYNRINQLEVTDQPLIIKGKPAFRKFLNVKYQITPEQAQQLFSNAPGVFMNSVIYTIVPQ